MPKTGRTQHIQHMLARQAFFGITKLMFSSLTELSHTRKAIHKKVTQREKHQQRLTQGPHKSANFGSVEF
jgi:hypothetical protein